MNAAFRASSKTNFYLGNEGLRYTFNGKETDPETDLQDYGMRIYNPRLGKFLSVDPLSMEYPWNSTYSFAENDVIRCIDLDGAERYYRNGVEMVGFMVHANPQPGDLFIPWDYAADYYQFVYSVDEQTGQGEWISFWQLHEVVIQEDKMQLTLDLEIPPQPKVIGEINGALFDVGVEHATGVASEVLEGFGAVFAVTDVAYAVSQGNTPSPTPISTCGDAVVQENYKQQLRISYTLGYDMFTATLEEYNEVEGLARVGGIYMTNAEYEQFQKDGSVNVNNLSDPNVYYSGYFYNGGPRDASGNEHTVFVVLVEGNVEAGGTVQLANTNSILINPSTDDSSCKE